MADVETLVDMGILEEQPQPPSDVPPAPPAEEQANRLALDTALAEAGVNKGASDAEAVTALAQMDAATVAAVASWVKHKKKDFGAK
ncbi:hypothetical protein ACFY7H_12875 [Streptomyces sp. NPDC012794]|uniref:hypothetical protein n=1 Tax=Streptomyces sp. NPDC012794 TaxID=3364850 RepID=UPI00367B27B1